jgi:hypothetical protein
VVELIMSDIGSLDASAAIPKRATPLAAKRFATLAWRQAKTWKDKRSGTEVRLHSKNWLVFGVGVEPVI